MTKFNNEYFQKLDFTEKQIKNYLNSAGKNLKIAETDKIPEVIFKFSYDALIKIGIALIASENYKVRSVAGHHIKILNIIGYLLEDRDIEGIGNIMRRQRNFDLYEGGTFISKKQSEEYLEFIKKVFLKAKKYIYGKNRSHQ